MDTERLEPDNPEPGEGAEAPRRSPDTVAPKPEAPPSLPAPPTPKVEVKTRTLPAAFYVGAGVAALGVVVMLWAAWRREP